jgi:hypothetical protein
MGLFINFVLFFIMVPHNLLSYDHV